jgi:hypothetical protein
MTPPLSRLIAFVDVERDEARRLAERELADPIYEDEPPLLQRLLEWVLRQLDQLFANAGSVLGGWGALVVLIPVALIAALVLWRFGPLARTAARGQSPVFGATKRTAAQYRRAADTADAGQDWTTSVLERFRAIVAGLEERDVLTTKAGRTADEAAREAGRLLPDVSEPLVAAAITFDDVRYGERDATPDEAATMRELERSIGSARISDEPADVRPALAVPR